MDLEIIVSGSFAFQNLGLRFALDDDQIDLKDFSIPLGSIFKIALTSACKFLHYPLIPGNEYHCGQLSPGTHCR